MRLLRTLLVFDKGGASQLADWAEVHQSIVRSISSIDFPEGTGALTIRRKQVRPDKQWDRNGVVYLKQRFLQHMTVDEGWRREASLTLDHLHTPTEVALYPSMEPHLEPITARFGPFDFSIVGNHGTKVAVEWETGNISSSHRSLNKLALAVKTGQIDAGVTIVPSRALYEHLTDRIGNINELSGYLAMWKGIGESVTRGLLAVVVVEHDALTDEGAYLAVGNDGRAAQGRSRRT